MNTVLIITYYWPPNGGVGVTRWLNTAKHLAQKGWKVIVFTADNDDFYLEDESPDIDKNIIVYKEKIFDIVDYLKKNLNLKNIKQGIPFESTSTSKLERFFLWLRANLFVPDYKILWTNNVYNKLLNIFDEHEVDIFVTTGPPHSMHLMGKRLQKDSYLPWIADFRDPWSQWELLDQMKVGKYALFRHKKKEKKVLKKANAIVTVSKTWKEEIEEIAGKDCIVIPNAATKRDIKYAKKSKFIILYAGMLNKNRNPIGLWKALKHLYTIHEIWKIRAEMHIYGNISPIIEDYIEEDDTLKEYVKINDYVPNEEIIEKIYTSDLLINCISQNEKAYGNIPLKLYEYLLTTRPIINFCSENHDAAKITTHIDGVYTFSPEEEEPIINHLLTLFDQWYVHDDDFQFERAPFYTYHQTASQWDELLKEHIDEDNDD